MKRKRTATVLLTLCLCLTMCVTAFSEEVARDEESYVRDSAGNMVWSGFDLTLPLDAVHTAFMIGKREAVKGTDIKGGLFSLGQDIEITDSRIGESAFLGAETVRLADTSVSGNIFAMGRKIDITGESNSVYAMGETVNFNGSAKCLDIGANSVFVGGTIDGDVSISSGAGVLIDPDTVITGRLNITGSVEPQIPESAQIGAYSFVQKVEEDDTEDPDERAEVVDDDEIREASEKAGKMAGAMAGALLIWRIFSFFFWIIAMSLMGMLLTWLFADQLKAAGESVKSSPGPALLRGVLAWLFTPVVAVLACLTIVLAPAGGLLLLFYLILICAGTCFTGASLGSLLFPKMNRFLSAFLCIAVLEILRQLPIIGTVIGILARMYLLSFVVKCLYDNIKNPPKTGRVPVPAAATGPVSGAPAEQGGKETDGENGINSEV